MDVPTGKQMVLISCYFKADPHNSVMATFLFVCCLFSLDFSFDLLSDEQYGYIIILR